MFALSKGSKHLLVSEIEIRATRTTKLTMQNDKPFESTLPGLCFKDNYKPK
jgi:hypothetical protein